MERRTITDTGCWEYDGSRTKAGYGQIRIGGRNGKTRCVHVVAYELLVGEIPEGLVLDHRVCDNPPCFNPEHLLPCTHRENILRGTGASARNAAKVECSKGHLLSGGNLYVRPGTSWRGCRQCRRDAMRRYYERQGR
jgi:hypothetical protein